MRAANTPCVMSDSVRGCMPGKRSNDMALNWVRNENELMERKRWDT